MTAALLFSLALGLQPGNPGGPVEEPPRLYGDEGSSHFGLTLGLGSGSHGFQWAGGLSYGYFIVDRMAPGIEGLVSGGTGLLTSGQLMANVRFVPLRIQSLALFLVGRGGRIFLEDHADGWGLGGSAGIIYFTNAHVGIQLSYEYLRLLPNGFCRDLSRGCSLHDYGLGLILAF
jgi:hypothetical protein